MNWKQQKVKEHIEWIFIPGTVAITVDGPESLKAIDNTGDSLIFWYDEESGLVMDAYHWKQQFEKWQATQQAGNAKEGGIYAEY